MGRKKRKRDRITKHHLTPKCRGGGNTSDNILYLKWKKHHSQWHNLFGNMTLEEIIECLQRIQRMKGRKDG